MDSGILVQKEEALWELCSAKHEEGCRCFGPEHIVCDKVVASGTLAACYDAAKMLQIHVDIIRPLK